MAKSFIEANNRLWDITRDLSFDLLDASIWNQERAVRFSQTYVNELRKAQTEVVTPYTNLIQHTKQAQEVVLDFWKAAYVHSTNNWSELARAQVHEFNQGVNEISERANGMARKAEESFSHLSHKAEENLSHN